MPFLYFPNDWDEVKVLVTQSCLTLCDPTDYSPSASSAHGISQTRTLESVPIPFPRGSSQPTDRTHSSSLQADSLPSEPPEKPNWLEHLVMWYLAIPEKCIKKFFAFSWILRVLYVFKMPGPYQIHDLSFYFIMHIYNFNETKFIYFSFVVCPFLGPTLKKTYLILS